MEDHMAGSRSRLAWLAWLAAAGLLIRSHDSPAQNADELAKQLSNPVASLTSVPAQFNYDDGLGEGEGSRFLVNVQPVVQVSIGNDWNMISRTIVPLISQEDILPDSGSQSGFGDTTQSLFFSLKAHTRSGWTWGVGPALLLRTASDDLLGSDIGYSKVATIGSQRVSYQAGARYYVEAPDNGAEWGLRFTFTLLFPQQ
jgi:hypothetical protein